MGEDVSALKLVKSIEENTKHYVEILSRAIDECMPQPTSEVTYVSYSAPENQEEREGGRVVILTRSQLQGRRLGCVDGTPTSPEPGDR